MLYVRQVANTHDEIETKKAGEGNEKGHTPPPFLEAPQIPYLVLH